MTLCNKSSHLKVSRYSKKRGLILPSNHSAELAYFCGVLTGDGSIYTRKNKHDYIIKCVGNPKDEKQFYSKVLSPIFSKLFGILPDMKIMDSGTTYGFVVYSKNIYDFLTQHLQMLSGRKDRRLKIPLWVLSSEKFCISFIRGLFDTDGSIALKKRHKSFPYYPVVSLSSKSKQLIVGLGTILEQIGFKIVYTLDYKVRDDRLRSHYSIINRLEMNGKRNLVLWMKMIGFSNPKHLKKTKIWEDNSGERI